MGELWLALATEQRCEGDFALNQGKKKLVSWHKFFSAKKSVSRLGSQSREGESVSMSTYLIISNPYSFYNSSVQTGVQIFCLFIE